MEAKQFAELLRNPLLVEQLPADELRDLLNRYPFSPSLQMLMLKHHQLNEHPAYDEQLAKAAIYAPDRRALYRLVQLKPVPGEAQPNYLIKEPEPIAEVLEETSVILEEEPALETSVPVEPEPSHADNGWNLPIEPPTELAPADAEPTEETIEPVAPEIEALPEEVQREILMPEPETVETAPLLEEIMGAALEYDLSDRIIPNETDIEPKEEEPVTEPEEATSLEAEAEQEVVGKEATETAETIAEEVEAPEEPPTASELVATEEEQVVEEDVINVTEIKTTNDVNPQLETRNSQPETIPVEPQPVTRNPKPETQKDSFIGWLKRVNRHEIPVGIGQQQQPEKEDGTSELDAIFVAGNYEASLLKDASELPVKPFVDPTAKHAKEELMEPDEEANKRMDAQAKKSLSMGEELVTETLAKIYEIQKKTGKAIEAYEILKTRHPHKAEEYDRKIQKLREN